MTCKLWRSLAVSALVLILPSFALAWKPAGGSVELVYWLGEMDFSGETDDMDGYGVEADVGIMPRLVASVDYYPTNGGGVFNRLDTNYVAVDLKWKLLDRGEKGFLAAGLGWQSTALTVPGDRISTKGIRLVLEGETTLGGPFHGYARYAHLPSLDDLAPQAIDGDGSEYALGLILDVKYFNIIAGYRVHDMSFEFTGTGPATIEIDNAGYAAGIHWRF